MLARAISLAGPWLTCGATLGMAGVLASRLLGLPGHWGLWAGMPVVVGGVVAVIRAWWGRVPLLAAASVVDQALGLKDRLSNGLAFAEGSFGAGIRGVKVGGGGSEVDPFVGAAVAEAEATAAAGRVQRAIPFRFGETWSVWPVLVVVTIALGIWLPPQSMLTRVSEARRATAERQRKDIVEQISKARSAIARAATTAAPGSAATPEQVRSLEDLERELTSNPASDPRQALDRAAETLQSAAAGAEADAQRAASTDDAVRERLDALARAHPPEPAESALSRAIRSGDLGAAEQAARAIDSATPRTSQGSGEKQANESLAKDLDRLASDLKELREREGREAVGDETSAQRPDPLDRKLDEQGLSREQALGAERSGDRESIQKELERAGVEPAAAQRLAEQLEARNDQRRAKQQAEDKTRELEEGLRQAAEEAREKSSPPKTEKGSGSESTSGSAPKPADGTGSSRSTSEERAESSPPAPGDKPPAESKEGTTQKTRAPIGKSAEQPQTNGTPSDGRGTPPKAEERNGGEAGAQPDTKREGGTEPGTRTPTEGGQKNDGASDESHSTPASGQSPSAARDLARQLRDLNAARERAAGERRNAEELRRQAREMMDRATPEQREQLNRWASGQNQKPGKGSGAEDRLGGSGSEAGSGSSKVGARPAAAPPPGESGPAQRTEIVDARPRPGQKPESNEREEVVAEWLGEGLKNGSVSERDRAGRILEEATKSAERAVEDRSVPARFDRLLRRYFQRLPEATGVKPPSTPVQPARDAGATTR